MTKAARKARKGSNGTGESLTVLFDQSDPAERRALEAARLLAAKHGRRKSAIIALLEAVYAHYEATGELLSASEISGALIGAAAAGQGAAGFPATSASVHDVQRNAEIILQSRTSRKRQPNSGIKVTNGGKASAETVAKNFLTSMKGLASGFFD